MAAMAEEAPALHYLLVQRLRLRIARLGSPGERMDSNLQAARESRTNLKGLQSMRRSIPGLRTFPL